jgi:hypothetical protein
MWMYNKRMKYARIACPTRKSLGLLLAAYSRRWAGDAAPDMSPLSEKSEVFASTVVFCGAGHAFAFRSRALSWSREHQVLRLMRSSTL